LNEELRQLREELRILQQQQQQLEQRLETAGRRLALLEQKHAAATAPEPQTRPQPAAPLEGAAAPAAPPAAPVTPQAGGKPRDLEARIGGIWLNRAGVLVFILGAAFFLKYAFDRGWINEMTRVAIGAAAAVALLIFGELNRRRGYIAYGHGLSGGGVALLYFTVSAAFHFYDVLPSTVGMALLVVITLGAVLLSVYQNAPAVAALGLLTAFLNPLLFAAGEPSLMPLLIYLVLLNLGILAVMYYKRWAFTGIISFILTISFLAGVTVLRHQGQMLDLGAGGYQAFLTLFLLLFCALPLLLYTAHRRPLPAEGAVLLVAGAAAYFGLSWFNLQPLYPLWMGWFTLALAAFYLLLGLAVRRLAARGREFSFCAFALTAALLIVFAPLQLRAGWITAAWLLQGVVLCYLGLRLADFRIRQGALAVLALALVRLLIADWWVPYRVQEYVFLWNSAAALTLLFIAALALCAWFYHRHAPLLPQYPRQPVRLFGVTAGLLALIFVSIEIVRYGGALAAATGEYSYYHNLRMLFLSLFWAAYAVALAVAGFILKIPYLRYSAFSLFGLTILKVFLLDLSALELVYRIISLVAVGLILLLVSYLYQRYRSRIDSAA